MAIINVLDQQTINQIAAGEVIERPASVVKELVENAVDAGASAVTVEIKEGGISFIRVTDNGCGIEKSQVPVAFLRHTTSKIRSAIDLMTVSSLGFRGEALSSIAAVSQVEMVTRVSEELTGTRYVIWDGEEKSIEEIGAPEGTTFLVRNLFYHTPARRKFLKAPQTEAGYVAVLLERMALSRPDISFRLIVNNQSKLHSAGNHKVRDLIYQLYGRETTSNLLPVSADIPGMKIEGFAGKPILARGNRNYEHYFINGRYVRSNIISKAIEDAYQGRLMQHKYPFTVLYLTINPDEIDVNVHPAKMELRFADNDQVYRQVYQAILAAFSGRELIPSVSVGKDSDGKKDSDGEKGREGGNEASGKEKGHGEAGPEPFEQNRIARLIRETGGYQSGPGQRFESRQSGQAGRRPGSEASEAGQEKAGGAKKAGADNAESAKSAGVDNAESAKSAGIVNAERTKSAGVDNAESAKYVGMDNAESAKCAGIDNAERTKSAGRENTEQVSKTGAERKNPAAEGNGQESAETHNKQMNLFEEKILTPTARMKYRFIGQLFDTYWLIQSGDELLIMDQHAAHEKVLFERFMARLSAKKEIYTQAMNPPAIVTLSAVEEELLNSHQDQFRQAGYEIEHFGGREYALYGVPADLPRINAEDFFLELLDGLGECSLSDSSMILETIASMSCKAAVKGNHAMSGQEAEALVDELMTLKNPFSCPHGRPTIIRMSKYELEKKFSRIV